MFRKEKKYFRYPIVILYYRAIEVTDPADMQVNILALRHRIPEFPTGIFPGERVANLRVGGHLNTETFDSTTLKAVYVQG
jgi:hypothetical protein